MSKRFFLGLVVLCLTGLAAQSVQAQANFHESLRRSKFRALPQAERWISIESAILDEVNQVRSSFGLPPLRMHPQLAEIARRHSRDMIERDYFDHLNPELENSKERVRRQLGAAPDRVAENLWMRLGALPYEGPEATARSIVAEWLASSGHRRNLLNAGFTHLGVGFHGSADGLHLRATQLFAEMSDRVEIAAQPKEN